MKFASPVTLKALKLFGFLALIGASAHAAEWPRNYEFIDLAKCREDRYFHPLCMQISGAHANWDAESRAVVEKHLANLPFKNLDKLAAVTHNLPKKITFVRLLDGKNVADTFVANGQIIVSLRPQFFIAENTLAGVPEKLHTLTHEFFHVYDFGWKESPFWRNLALAAGWGNTRNLNPITRVPEVRVAANTMNELYTNGSPEARQRAANIDASVSHPRGLPSIYGTTNLEEYFAELATFLTFDVSLAAKLPQEVVAVLQKSDVKFLLDGANLPAPEKKQPRAETLARATIPDDSFRGLVHLARFNSSEFLERPRSGVLFGEPLDPSFVGLLHIENRPWCTGTLIKHGVVVLAKQCVLPYVTRKSNEPYRPTYHTYFTFEFRRGSESLLFIDGFSMDVTLDPGPGEFAYITYDPKRTENLIEIPKLRFAAKTDFAGASKKVFTVGFPLPYKARRMVAQWSGYCGLGSFETSSISCPAWVGSGGSPVLSEDPKVPDGFIYWGIVNNSTAVNLGVQPIPYKQKDSWGYATDSLFEPLQLEHIPEPFLGSL